MEVNGRLRAEEGKDLRDVTKPLMIGKEPKLLTLAKHDILRVGSC